MGVRRHSLACRTSAVQCSASLLTAQPITLSFQMPWRSRTCHRFAATEIWLLMIEPNEKLLCPWSWTADQTRRKGLERHRPRPWFL
ncbi:hypothetical protein BCV70DRAFT_4083 [Testicularia cyperi]|uniref:Uncharacterized protein n=1 Tax=Testicularia cyperi TaxID=1882483 RepID=A0A317XWN0_9BASI|nr:hypothetical protein BCV70DRAFT_4083 [Testicularia cyperi]